MTGFAIYVVGMIVALILGALEYNYEHSHQLVENKDRQMKHEEIPGIFAVISLCSWVAVVGLLITCYKGIWWSFWHWFEDIE